jgi:hypothetical protein
MVGIGVLITKYISLAPQPGIVECQLFDAYGNEWTFQDKTDGSKSMKKARNGAAKTSAFLLPALQSCKQRNETADDRPANCLGRYLAPINAAKYR